MLAHKYNTNEKWRFKRLEVQGPFARWRLLAFSAPLVSIKYLACQCELVLVLQGTYRNSYCVGTGSVWNEPAINVAVQLLKQRFGPATSRANDVAGP